MKRLLKRPWNLLQRLLYTDTDLLIQNPECQDQQQEEYSQSLHILKHSQLLPGISQSCRQLLLYPVLISEHPDCSDMRCHRLV